MFRSFFSPTNSSLCSSDPKRRTWFCLACPFLLGVCLAQLKLALPPPCSLPVRKIRISRTPPPQNPTFFVPLFFFFFLTCSPLLGGTSPTGPPRATEWSFFFGLAVPGFNRCQAEPVPPLVIVLGKHCPFPFFAGESFFARKVPSEIPGFFLSVFGQLPFSPLEDYPFPLPVRGRFMRSSSLRVPLLFSENRLVLMDFGLEFFFS